MLWISVFAAERPLALMIKPTDASGDQSDWVVFLRTALGMTLLDNGFSVEPGGKTALVIESSEPKPQDLSSLAKDLPNASLVQNYTSVRLIGTWKLTRADGSVAQGNFSEPGADKGKKAAVNRAAQKVAKIVATQVRGAFEGPLPASSGTPSGDGGFSMELGKKKELQKRFLEIWALKRGGATNTELAALYTGKKWNPEAPVDSFLPLSEMTAEFTLSGTLPAIRYTYQIHGSGPAEKRTSMELLNAAALQNALEPQIPKVGNGALNRYVWRNLTTAADLAKHLEGPTVVSGETAFTLKGAPSKALLGFCRQDFSVRPLAVSIRMEGEAAANDVSIKMLLTSLMNRMSTNGIAVKDDAPWVVAIQPQHKEGSSAIPEIPSSFLTSKWTAPWTLIRKGATAMQGTETGNGIGLNAEAAAAYGAESLAKKLEAAFGSALVQSHYGDLKTGL